MTDDERQQLLARKAELERLLAEQPAPAPAPAPPTPAPPTLKLAAKTPQEMTDDELMSELRRRCVLTPPAPTLVPAPLQVPEDRPRETDEGLRQIFADVFRDSMRWRNAVGEAMATGGGQRMVANVIKALYYPDIGDQHHD